MKNCIILFWLVNFSGILTSSWKINNIVNNSDLQVVSASYTKPTKKKIGYLSKIIKQAGNAGTIQFDYAVHQRSKGCSLIDLSNGYSLVLDGHPTHSIMWDRLKVNKKCAGKGLLDVHKDSYAARIFLEKNGEVLGCAVRGYNQEGALFDIVISGQNGDYVASLQNVWDQK